MSPILLAIASMLLWGVSDFAVKKLTDRLDVQATAFYKTLAHVLLLAIVFLVVGFTVPHGSVWFWIVASGMIGAAGFLCFVKALRSGVVSLNVPIAHSYILLTAILSAIFFDDTLSPLQFFAIALLVIAVLVLTIDFSSLRRPSPIIRSGVLWALVTAACWGVLYTIVKVVVDAIGPYASAFYLDLAVLCFLTIRQFIKARPFERRLLEARSLLWIAAGSAASAAATVTMLLAIAEGRLSITMGIIAASPVVVFFLAYLFLKERVTRIQTAAVLLIIVCLAVLGGSA
jgi:uncharacterized membrane protein